VVDHRSCQLIVFNVLFNYLRVLVIAGKQRG